MLIVVFANNIWLGIRDVYVNSSIGKVYNMQ